LELWYLKPADEGSARNTSRPCRFLDIPLGQEGSNRFFLLSIEFGPMALYQTLSKPIWRPPASSERLLEHRNYSVRIGLLVFPTGVMNVIAADISGKGQQPK
jgi:hypothetical protein